VTRPYFCPENADRLVAEGAEELRTAKINKNAEREFHFLHFIPVLCCSQFLSALSG
jgi:hypothetical protein